MLKPILEPLYAAYAAVKKARDAREPLDLDLPERKILLRPGGTVDRIITPERLDAHKLIEEFMIQANVAAADRAAAFAAGMDDCLAKPLEREALLRWLERLSQGSAGSLTA